MTTISVHDARAALAALGETVRIDAVPLVGLVRRDPVEGHGIEGEGLYLLLSPDAPHPVRGQPVECSAGAYRVRGVQVDGSGFVRVTLGA